MSTVISAAVTDELAERIDAEREGEGDDRESRSSAVNRLIREGLDAEENEGKTVLTPRIYLMWFGTLFVLAPNTEPASMGGTAMMGLGALLVGVAAIYPKLQ
jgi:metal-responsive CopG/Arc/MetJ family transcriptional regulator